MTMVAVPCSHTIRQKSGTESGTGPGGDSCSKMKYVRSIIRRVYQQTLCCNVGILLIVALMKKGVWSTLILWM